MNRPALLDCPEKIKGLDPQGMLDMVARMPEMWKAAAEIGQAIELKPLKNIRQIVICGLGGSAIAGDIVSDLLANSCPRPIFINRNYQLPAFVNDETLVFALSYSGNTEETLSAVKMAVSRQANIIGVTSGGKLRQIIAENKSPCFVIPEGYQPRAALAFMLGPLLYSLAQLGLSPISPVEIGAAANPLGQLAYGPSQPGKNNPAKQLAVKLLDRTPIILGVNGITGAAAYRFKTQLSENSKVTALVNVFPELNHNELVNLAALTRGKHNFSLILLRSEFESERMKKRIELTKSLVGGQIGGINELPARGKNLLEQVLSLIFLTDFVTIYLAILRGVNPTEVEAINRLKKELAR
ncbi:bifunctional phosphoglucose/phosphomannose isomerase [Candidatus Saganbacteria bacterium]|nr:bifunctional phosphoglucose/phosphomannose isomerase [Candidatus Saganbacteria bacterium]